MAVAVPFCGKFEREVKNMTIDEIREKYNRDDSSSIAFNERMHRIKKYNPDKDERGYEKVNAYITSANNKLGSNVHIISDMKYKGVPRFSIRVLGSHEYKTIGEAKAIISKIQEAIELVKNAPKPAMKG